MKKSISAAIAGAAVVALSVTPAAAVAVTELPAGDQMVTSIGGDGIFEFLDENWTGTTRFDPVQNEMTYAIGLTFNPADGMIYGVNGWFDSLTDQQVFSVNPTTGASDAWDIDYGNGDSSGYETRSIAFDGEGNLVSLVCRQTEVLDEPGVYDCPNTGLQQFLVSLTLTDDGVAEAGTFLELDYGFDEILASVAWNPSTESFFVLGYDPHDLAEVETDGSLGEILDVTPEGFDPDAAETTDLAFDSNGIAWICYSYCERFISVDFSDDTITDVVSGNDVEGMTILRPYTALAETGPHSSNLALWALTAASALGAGAWFSRRRRS